MTSSVLREYVKGLSMIDKILSKVLDQDVTGMNVSGINYLAHKQFGSPQFTFHTRKNDRYFIVKEGLLILATITDIEEGTRVRLDEPTDNGQSKFACYGLFDAVEHLATQSGTALASTLNRDINHFREKEIIKMVKREKSLSLAQKSSYHLFLRNKYIKDNKKKRGVEWWHIDDLVPERLISSHDPKAF